LDLGGPFTRIAILIRKLVEKVAPGANRLSLAESVIDKWTTLDFALECFRWLRRSKDSSEDQVFSESEENRLVDLILGRIRKYAEEQPVYNHSKAAFLIFIWGEYGPTGELELMFVNPWRKTPTRLLGFLWNTQPSLRERPRALCFGTN